MSDAPGIQAARGVIADAITRRVFPAAALQVGSSSTLLWREAFGRRTFEPDAPLATVETIFDLASLTKPLATTMAILDLAARGRVALSERIADSFREWSGKDRDEVTVADLLEHASGLPARLLEAPPLSRPEFEHETCALPLEYPPRTASIYSDLGFILLGFLAADRAGEPLDRVFARLVNLVASGDPDASERTLGFSVPPMTHGNTAPTDPLPDDRRQGRRLVGEVHDNYAAALNGIAGHAGLFGSAAAVGAMARAVLRAARGADLLPAPFSVAATTRAVTRSTVAASSRALGWDTMLPTSSCGTRLSAPAFGHVGFTGTSLWIDPVRDRYFVLLTNRVCGGGTLQDMRFVRRAFHDALGDL